MQAVLASLQGQLIINSDDDESDAESDSGEVQGAESGAYEPASAHVMDGSMDNLLNIEGSTAQMLEVYMNEVQNFGLEIEMTDAETNTECAFLPERAKARLRDRTGSVSVLMQQQNTSTTSTSTSPCPTMDDRLVKRSQTFSPSAVVSKSRYTCRRSDSDSAMHFNTVTQPPHPFRRGAVERRSLRYHSKVNRSVSSNIF